MHLRAKTLDDLIRKVFKILVKSRKRITPSKGCGEGKDWSFIRAQQSKGSTLPYGI